MYEGTWLTDGWESRFLGTHIMQRLVPGQWQQILRGMLAIPVQAGECVVQQGEPGGEFYVLAAGVGAALWVLVIALVVGSVIGLFYYLRVVTK